MRTETDPGKALFLKRWLHRPLAMGAFLPSGPFLCEAMADATLVAINGYSGNVVELGPGTGEITKALLAAGIDPDRLVLVERDPKLAAYLRRRFNGLKIIEGDAAQLPHLLAANGIHDIVAIVSGLPLLTLPPQVVRRIVHGVFESLPHGGSMVQFTYGPALPISKGLRRSLELAAVDRRRVWRNVLPAVVWTFTSAPMGNQAHVARTNRKI